MCIPGLQLTSLGLVALAFYPLGYLTGPEFSISYYPFIHLPKNTDLNSPAGAEKRGFKLKPFQGEQKLLTLVALSSSFEEAGVILTLSLLENTVKGGWGVRHKDRGNAIYRPTPTPKRAKLTDIAAF